MRVGNYKALEQIVRKRHILRMTVLRIILMNLLLSAVIVGVLFLYGVRL
jgi:hypothetical protein